MGETSSSLIAADRSESDGAALALDANHPLAGMDLTFDLEATAMCDPTDDEMAHGHAHRPGGHHHH